MKLFFVQLQERSGTEGKLKIINVYLRSCRLWNGFNEEYHKTGAVINWPLEGAKRKVAKKIAKRIESSVSTFIYVSCFEHLGPEGYLERVLTQY